MLKEDYIMRLFQQFSEALAKWLSKRKTDNPEMVVSFNDELVKPYLEEDLEFFESRSVDELLDYFQEKYSLKAEFESRLEILAELFYQKGMIEDVKPHSLVLFQKSKDLLNFLSQHDKTYSVARQDRINNINEILGNEFYS